eukprot:2296889-Ditylum_brightwellii.AAC.1
MVTINAFNRFCNLKADSSNKESDPEVNALAAADNNDSDSNASCLPSKDSGSNNKWMADHDLAANDNNDN